MDEFEKDAYEYALSLHYKKERPAVVVGAKYLNSKSFARSGRMPDEDFFDRLIERLLKYGPIGSQYNGSSVGCCAEVNATNPIYHEYTSIELNSITLSTAYRPRTMEVKEKCQICTEIFLKDAL